MIRKAFAMKLKPGSEAEYETRHNPIWPDLRRTLKDHGVSNYSLLLHPDSLQLFGYVELESEERYDVSVWNYDGGRGMPEMWTHAEATGDVTQ